MSYLGKLVSQTGKEYFVFTSEKDAQDYVALHGLSRYAVKPITVYGAYYAPKQKVAGGKDG